MRKRTLHAHTAIGYPVTNRRFHLTTKVFALLFVFMSLQALAKENDVTPNGFPLHPVPLEAPTIRTDEGENMTVSSIASETGYWINGKEVHFVDKLIANADPKSFKFFDNSVYAKDKHSVYAREKKLKGADPASFVPIAMAYAKDNAHSYHWHTTISGADSKSFRVLDPRSAYSRDKLHLFKRHLQVDKIDPDSFRYLDAGIFTDKNGAYSISPVSDDSTSVKLTPITNVDPKTLVALGRRYFKDNKTVFTMTFDGKLNVIPGSDARSFESLKSGWAKDKSHVYRDGERMDGVSPIDFKVPDSH